MQPVNPIPIATYRLQFNSQFTLKHALEIVDFLNQLGISHCYASPILAAKPGSMHGYDVIDHSRLNPEIGTEEEFSSFVEKLHKHRMGLIVDIVPNHMYIAHAANLWWNDLLENGPASIYAGYFDIDWNPPRIELVNKVLLPLLDQQYGSALENQVLQVNYKKGAFHVELPAMELPTDPKSWALILESLAKEATTLLPESHPHLQELQSVVTALTHLPLTTDTAPEKIAERQREKEVIKKRLASLIEEDQVLAKLLSKNLKTINGTKGDPHSFDLLETFLNAQPYRLCFWRVANDEINFRRFFDIFELAGIRTEKQEVFEAVHEQIFKWIRQKMIDGIRIDHIDGLWDPEQYLEELQSYCSNTPKESIDPKKLFYVIAEKILTGNERLRPEWLLHGTVGYDFLNQVNGMQVFLPNKKAIYDIYRSFTDYNIATSELIYFSKRLILIVSMSSELYVLARHLDRISEQHRSSRDFTQESLRAALRDVIACFPVYRSYIRAEQEQIHEEDRQYILAAIKRAKRLNPAISTFIFDFIQSVLLLEHPTGIDDAQKAKRKDFVMRFQQLTGPVMAKGVEDTAFYRFYPLTSLNEVGADPHAFGISVDLFHKKNQERLEVWPHTKITTSTHDTKRSEDVRARINVLSEIPQEWQQMLERWAQMNKPHKILEGEESIPDANEEYLLYQTLIGTWPLYPMDPPAHLQYMNRIQAYMEKALKEAKIHTSWVNPNKDYDEGVQQFIQKILALDPSANPFLKDFQATIPKIASAGMLNSLSQLLLKLTCPGIPDIYPGNETWTFNLVDPDNRRPIDFTNGKYLLKSIVEKLPNPSNLLQQLMEHPEDGRIKLFVTLKALNFRQKEPLLFSHGAYIPLEVQGPRQNHIVAFARKREGKTAVVITSRFFTSLMSGSQPQIEPSKWRNTYVVIPEGINEKFSNIFNGEQALSDHRNNQNVLDLEKIFVSAPFALLESNQNG